MMEINWNEPVSAQILAKIREVVKEEHPSLRDYFAAQALVALAEPLAHFLSDHGSAKFDAEALARDAYRIADLMLKEREK